MHKELEFEQVSVEEARRVLEPVVGYRPGLIRKPRRALAARPPDALAEATIAWIVALPAAVAPHEVAQRFPRIANTLCALWRQPVRCETYLNGLLISDRAGRVGFPGAVMRELSTLTEHYRELYPARIATWSFVPMR